MKKEEKYINHLFELAKNDPPKRSFEEIATQFENSVGTPIPTSPSWKTLLTKSIHLNTILMFSTGSLLALLFLWFGTTSTEQTLVIENQEPLLTESVTTGNSSPSLPSNYQSFTQNESQQNEGIKNASSGKIVMTKETTEITLSNLVTKPLSPPIIPSPTTSEMQPIQNEGLQSIAVANASERKAAHAPTPLSSSQESTASPIPITSAPISSQQLLPSSSSNGKIKKKELTDAREILFSLKYTDSEKTTAAFLDMIRAYGFKISERISRGSNKIHKINLHFTHYKGLDWKMKLRNFEALEINVILDEHKDPIGITYRLNQTGKFCKPIKLHDIAKSNHKFSKVRSKGNHTFTHHSQKKN